MWGIVLKARGVYLTRRMQWTAARERLGAEVIGGREDIAHRWRRALRDQGAMPWSLERCAVELILQAGAALADGAPGEAPWRRCGALLRIDSHDHGRGLSLELTHLWQSTHPHTDAAGRPGGGEGGGLRVGSAGRGAAAEIRAALLDDGDAGDAPRFGGPIAVC